MTTEISWADVFSVGSTLGTVPNRMDEYYDPMHLTYEHVEQAQGYLTYEHVEQAQG